MKKFRKKEKTKEEAKEKNSLLDDKIKLAEIVQLVWRKKIFIITTVLVVTVVTGALVYTFHTPQYQSSVFFGVDIPRNTERQASLASYRFEEIQKYCASHADVTVDTDKDLARMSWVSDSPESAKKLAEAGFADLQEFLKNEDNNPLVQRRKEFERQLDELGTKIVKLELEALQSNGESFELQDELDAMYAEFKIVSNKLGIARLEEDGSAVSLTIFAAPSVSYQTVKPKVKFFVAASFMMSGLLVVLLLLFGYPVRIKSYDLLSLVKNKRFSFR